MANVVTKTTYTDAGGNLTTDESKGLFLVAREGSEITPEMASNYPGLTGAESTGTEGDSTLSPAEAATVEANASAVYARRQAEITQGENLGDPADLTEAARKAALKEQSALAAGLSGSDDAGSDDAPKGRKSATPAENK